MTTLQPPCYHVILRSSDGSGQNNQKTFNVVLRNLLTSTFTQYNLKVKFASTSGDFNGSVAEVRWDATNSNQWDSRVGSAGSTLCFPKILTETDVNGAIVGSILYHDFDSSPPLLIIPSSSTTLQISVYDINGDLLDNMTSWIMKLTFEPVVQRQTTTRR